MSKLAIILVILLVLVCVFAQEAEERLVKLEELEKNVNPHLYRHAVYNPKSGYNNYYWLSQ
jgi:hypothetical protein